MDGNPVAAPPKKRIFEIDVLRAVAIIMMSLFHLVFDLFAYFGVDVDIYTGFWFWVGRLSAILFMVVSGISSTLGGKPVRRGLMVLGAALVVTLVSIPTMGQNYVRFGILHFFAAVMILKGLYEKLVKSWGARLCTALLLIPLCFWLGEKVRAVQSGTFWFLPLGITYPGFSSFDYYPLLPWAGWFCTGIAAGMLLYRNRQSLFSLDIRLPQQKPAAKLARGVLRPLAFLGRHSLLVYLLHQPLILALLYGLHFLGIL